MKFQSGLLNSIINTDSNSYRQAYTDYCEIGKQYLNFAESCKQECTNEISKKTLPVFYMRQALLHYERALYCIEQYIDAVDLPSEQLQSLHNELESFYRATLQNLAPLMNHPLHKIKVDPFIFKWKNLDEKLLDTLLNLGISRSFPKSENSAAERLISSPTLQYTDDDSPQSSDYTVRRRT